MTLLSFTHINFLDSGNKSDVSEKNDIFWPTFSIRLKNSVELCIKHKKMNDFFGDQIECRLIRKHLFYLLIYLFTSI